MRPALRAAALLVLAAALVACGPSARTRTLHATLATVDAARVGFIAFDNETQAAIVANAKNIDDGRARLALYRQRREGAVLAFETAYRVLALALADHADVPRVLDALGQLEAVLDELQKWRNR